MSTFVNTPTTSVIMNAAPQLVCDLFAKQNYRRTTRRSRFRIAARLNADSARFCLRPPDDPRTRDHFVHFARSRRSTRRPGRRKNDDRHDRTVLDRSSEARAKAEEWPVEHRGAINRLQWKRRLAYTSCSAVRTACHKGVHTE